MSWFRVTLDSSVEKKCRKVGQHINHTHTVLCPTYELQRLYGSSQGNHTSPDHVSFILQEDSKTKNVFIDFRFISKPA